MFHNFHLTLGELAVISALSPISAVIASALTYRFKVKRDLVKDKLSSENSLKRECYRDLIYGIETWLERSQAGDSRGVRSAEDIINKAIAMIDLLSPQKIYREASKVMEFVSRDRGDESRESYIDNMYSMMREDLNTPNPSYSLNDN